MSIYKIIQNTPAANSYSSTISRAPAKFALICDRAQSGTICALGA
jgi:hypothetical protein